MLLLEVFCLRDSMRKENVSSAERRGAFQCARRRSFQLGDIVYAICSRTIYEILAKNVMRHEVVDDKYDDAIHQAEAALAQISRTH